MTFVLAFVGFVAGTLVGAVLSIAFDALGIGWNDYVSGALTLAGTVAGAVY